MKKIKIPIEFLIELSRIDMLKKDGNGQMSEEYKIIVQNKKYFNHIGIA